MKTLPEIKDQIAIDQYGKEWHMLTDSQQNQEIDRVAIAYAEQFKVEVETRKPAFFDSLGKSVYNGDRYYFVDGYIIMSSICNDLSGYAGGITYFKCIDDAEAYLKKIK